MSGWMPEGFESFRQKGKASFIIGGQWGSEGKGAAAAWVAEKLPSFDLYTTNAGAQAGHTSYFNDKKIVVFHLSTAAVIDWWKRGKTTAKPIFVNAGAVIDVDVFLKEVEDYYDASMVFVHPMAAVISAEDRAASRAAGSASEKRSGVRKGVGQALAQKVLRTGKTAKDDPRLAPFVRRLAPLIAYNYCEIVLRSGGSVLVEVPQGVSLSLNHSGFYPFTTSRDCTVMTAMADAAIHPIFYGQTMMVLRTFPIRVGNIKDEHGVEIGYSGGRYLDQDETTWEELDQMPEITTVSKRIRRVFTFSRAQLLESMALTKPSWVFLTFCNYTCNYPQNQYEMQGIKDAISSYDLSGGLIYQWGPTSEDVGNWEDLKHALIR